jgi:hypothetical protein
MDQQPGDRGPARKVWAEGGYSGEVALVEWFRSGLCPNHRERTIEFTRAPRVG